ncbi:subtilisin-like protein [Cryphonectria parasitica EP155]|uniref:Subtilisin-like protein n=1 Tax=Cryphonectria parasitica (strain ATCC 38755 / EP155) TaxID=660469 RepID=A0A9P4XVN6_CRYP1|nr:subtilisin-like protein [Cryphonectria parasitica EP155]KAF3761776.1 subtilisin-like protein [Cryphonectria parasitica EP155]
MGTALAGQPLNLTAATEENFIAGAYIVEFADGHDQTSFYNILDASGISVNPRMNINSTVFSGASFSVTDLASEKHQVARISALRAVRQVWPVRKYSLPELMRNGTMPNPMSGDIMLDEEFDNIVDKFSPHVMTQVDKLHAESYFGHGIRIGIVDTGVDYRHPALGGCFGKNCLIEYGYDLVGDSWTGYDAPKPDPDPYDNCIGHGTHVSGIIAAQKNRMNFTGVAPGVKLGMYKVFSCEGLGTTDDVLISAFGMAFDDGSDIITASLGTAGGWSETPFGVVASRIISEGVPCTLAAGNDGYSGLFTASDAADGTDVTGVASFDNIVTPYLLPKGTYTASTTHDNATEPAAFSWVPGYSSFLNISLPLKALSSNSTVENDACSSLAPDTGDLSGYAVLIRLGGCEPSVKARNAQLLNANAILFYADILEDFGPTAVWYPDMTITSTATITPAQGAKFIQLLNDGSEVRLTFIDPSYAEVVFKQVPNRLTGGFASAYTSWGPTWELAFYPSVAAPGGNILSTFPLNQGAYAVFSGTSMATPFVAGVYALLMQIRKTKRNPAELARILSSTSKANLWNDGAGTINGLAPTAQQGSGLIQAYDAAFTTTLVDSTGISFNDTDNLPPNATFTIQNIGGETVTYHMSHSPALGMYTLSLTSSYPDSFPNRIFAASAEVEFSEKLVNIPAGGRAEITVTLSPPQDFVLYDASLPVYGGYFVLNGSNNGNLTIPYLGVAGSMKQAVILDREDGSLPRSPDLIFKGAPALTYTIPYPTMDNTEKPSHDARYPWASARLDLGTRMLRADVVPLSKNYTGPTTVVAGTTIAGSVWGYPLEYVSGRYDGYVVFTGRLSDGTVVPEGRYALYLRALSIFGDPNEANDWQGMTKIPFDLRYQKVNP